MSIRIRNTIVIDDSRNVGNIQGITYGDGTTQTSASASLVETENSNGYQLLYSFLYTAPTTSRGSFDKPQNYSTYYLESVWAPARERSDDDYAHDGGIERIFISLTDPEAYETSKYLSEVSGWTQSLNNWQYGYDIALGSYETMEVLAVGAPGYKWNGIPNVISQSLMANMGKVDIYVNIPFVKKSVYNEEFNTKSISERFRGSVDGGNDFSLPYLDIYHNQTNTYNGVHELYKHAATIHNPNIFRYEPYVNTPAYLNIGQRNNDGAMADRFGETIAMSGDNIVISAPYNAYEYESGYQQGSIYLFSLKKLLRYYPPLRYPSDTPESPGGSRVSRVIEMSDIDDQREATRKALIGHYTSSFTGTKNLGYRLAINGSYIVAAAKDSTNNKTFLQSYEIPNFSLFHYDSTAGNGDLQTTSLTPLAGGAYVTDGSSSIGELLITDDNLVIWGAPEESTYSSFGHVSISDPQTMSGTSHLSPDEYGEDAVGYGLSTRYGTSISYDAGILAVGAPGYSTDGSGCVYVYERTSSGWNRLFRLDSPYPDRRNFGFRVSLKNGHLAVMGERGIYTYIYDLYTPGGPTMVSSYSFSSGYGVNTIGSGNPGYTKVLLGQSKIYRAAPFSDITGTYQDQNYNSYNISFTQLGNVDINQYKANLNIENLLNLI